MQCLLARGVSVVHQQRVVEQDWGEDKIEGKEYSLERVSS